ncbi:hypothetical protein BaRGS_00037419, partial [Batillaria attramentaria]
FKTGREKRFLGIAIDHHHHPNVPPEFTTCPRSITRVADRGKTSASGVYWHTPTTMDPNGGDSWTMLLLTRPGPGGTFRQGRSVVEYKVRDRGGLSNYCRFYVYVTGISCGHPGSLVNDVEQPKFVSGCPQDRTLYSGPLGAPVPLRWIDPQTTDNSNSVTLSSVPPKGTMVEPGYHTVRLTATDAAGNQNQCSFFVNVEHVEPPEFPSDCTPNIEVYASRLGHPTIVRWNSPSVTDNSGVQPTVSSDVIPGTAFPVGITKVTYSATDRSGNTRQCDFTVTVTPLTCRDPRQEVEPDTRVVINPPDCPDDHVHGASCTFTCSRSYPLIGPDTVTCERDDSTYPPTMAWKWSVSACNQSDLGVPVHGALACQLGNFGWDCLLACREGWDVPQKSDGHFLCTNSDGFWNPAKVPDCVVPMRPNHVRILTDMFYYMGSCSNSTDELKREFIQHLNNSPWKDACTNVASCIPENIQVTCGPLSRRKRSADSFPGADHLNTRRRRQTGSFYIDITFEIVMDFEDNGRTQEQAFQDLSTTQNEILQQLRKDAKAGLFNIGNLTADEDSVAQDGISADCPQGTLFKETTETKSLSCEMCKTGSRSSTGFVPCQPCPPGKYQSRMGATDCDVCPAGTWTRDKGAGGLDQCVPVDARLVDSSVSASVVGQWSNLSVSAWFFLHSNASAVFNVTFGSDTVSVYLYSASSQDKPGMLQSRQMSHEVKEAAWSRCVVVNDPVNITVYFNDTLLKSFPQQSVLSTPASGSIAVEGINGKVLVSGMHAVKDTLDIAAIRQSDKKCMGDNSANLLVWTPSPVILVMPSVCDAVDECLQAPCGPHPCENLVDGFVCHCQDGWSGDTCSTPPDPCYNNDCRNGATCVSSADNYTCTCLPGYAGRLCELEKKQNLNNDSLQSTETGQSGVSGVCVAFPVVEGETTRKRMCTNPAPAHGGTDCDGEDTEADTCNSSPCPGPRTVRRSTMTQSIVMNANCDDNTASAVRNGVQNNMQSLPCADQKICTTEITSSCAHSSRSKRDTSQLHLHLNMDVDFGPSADLIPNDTASLQKYVELVKLAEESASMVVLNDTRDLFTVNVGGKTITPDVTSVSFNTSLHCPPGTTDIEFLCVDCPAGSMEKDGSCVPCPLAQYQDEPASTNCKHCPPGLSWDVLGATGIDQCILPHKTNNESNQKDDSDVAVIVGAVCGSVVVIGVVAMVLFYLYKRDVLRNLRERWLGNRFRYNNKVSPAPSRPTSPPGYWELSTPLPPAFGISVEGNKVPPANTNCAYFEFPSLNNNVLVGRENTVADLQFRLVNDDCFRMTDFEIFVSKLEKDYTFTRYCRILITNGSCLLSGVDSVCRCTEEKGVYVFSKLLLRTDSTVWIWSTNGQWAVAGKVNFRITCPPEFVGAVTKEIKLLSGQDAQLSFSVRTHTVDFDECWMSKLSPSHLPHQGQFVVNCSGASVENFQFLSGQEADMTFHFRTHTKELTRCQVTRWAMNETDHGWDCGSQITVSGILPDLMLHVHLDNLTKEMEGEWRLELSNAVGVGYVDLFLTEFQSPPQFAELTEKTLNAAYGEQFVMTFPVVTHTEKIEECWMSKYPSCVLDETTTADRQAVEVNADDKVINCTRSGRRCHAVPGNQEAERDMEGVMPDEYEMHGMLYERGIQGEHRAQDEREMHGMLYERGIQGEHSAQDERDMYTPLRRLSRVAQRGRSAVISAVSGIYDIIR